MENRKEVVLNALYKKAIGEKTVEECSEYALDESGREVLAKRKVIIKTYPADLSAIKLLIELSDKELKDELENMTTEELIEEGKKLFDDFYSYVEKYNQNKELIKEKL